MRVIIKHSVNQVGNIILGSKTFVITTLDMIQSIKVSEVQY